MGSASRLIMLLTIPFPSLLFRHPLPRRLFTTATLTFARPRTRPLLPSLKSSSSLHTQPTASTSTSTSTSTATTANNNNSNNTSIISASHPWPEWSHLINTLLTPSTSAGRQGFSAAEEHGILPEDAFVAYEEKQLSTDFVKAASALLAFAHHNPILLRELSRRNIEVVVSNGTPFLFKTALETARRMRTFLGVDGANVLESDKANTVDLMKYILSYASNPTVPSERSNIYSRELVESSVRNLLCELAEVNRGTPVLDQPAGGGNQFPGRYGQTPRPLNQNIVMKRGDWTCPKCNFMNFARNNMCLECEEPRPKRQLTGGEWECPQCDFFNYGRNTVCLRCDCKRPGPALINPVNSMPASGYTGDYAYKTNIDSRLAENEEKAQRWFSKVSQLDNASDVSSGAADEDFPEIMPLRKGENKFVVSTRKTPLERRLANAPEGKVSQLGGTGNNLDKSIRRSLDQILGHSAAGSPNDDEGLTSVQNSVTENSRSLPKSGTSEYGRSQEGDSNYVPFVPLPADMFSNKNQKSKMGDGEDTVTRSCSEASSQTDSITLKNESGMIENSQLPEKLESQHSSINKEKEQADKSEIWFKRMAELHNVKDLPSVVSDEDFPEIMPMRKGENRFVVSKKKDRSLTSPTYRRQQAMEQANTTKYVPFVPFPPGYFARKDSQPPSESDSSVKPTDQVPSNAMATKRSPPGLDNARYGAADVNAIHKTNNQQSSSVIGNSQSGDDGIHFNRNSNQRSFPQVASKFGEVNTSQPKNYAEGLPNGNPWKEATTQSLDFTGDSTSENSGAQNTSHSMSAPGASLQVLENQNVRSGWTGKSLEGSAVTEPDPLDMSEEAKAERWFRRSAQIKDISELSQIPDEDFPSIMPMRKGVNRFVVSKRKTPLERRLTSPQYRRNLPVVSSDPTKKDNNNNSETK